MVLFASVRKVSWDTACDGRAKCPALCDAAEDSSDAEVAESEDGAPPLVAATLLTVA